jgi:diphthamide synthase (EF-2-diphthine--ammonia ligase)
VDGPDSLAHAACAAGVALSFSGGKDCVLALHRCRAARLRVACLVTFVPAEAPRFLAHPLPVIAAQAAALGLPWRRCPLRGLDYAQSYRGAIAALAADFGVSALVTGDLADVCDNFLPRAAAGTGVRVVRPLFGACRRGVLAELLGAGFCVIVSCADLRACSAALAERLVGAHLGADALQGGALADALAAEGVDACGEHGEFHTWVLSGPGFAHAVALGAAGCEHGAQAVPGEARVSPDGAYLHWHAPLCDAALPRAAAGRGRMTRGRACGRWTGCVNARVARVCCRATRSRVLRARHHVTAQRGVQEPCLRATARRHKPAITASGILSDTSRDETAEWSDR